MDRSHYYKIFRFYCYEYHFPLNDVIATRLLSFIFLYIYYAGLFFLFFPSIEFEYKRTHRRAFVFFVLCVCVWRLHNALDELFRFSQHAINIRIRSGDDRWRSECRGSEQFVECSGNGG